jgi:hypothetical protein
VSIKSEIVLKKDQARPDKFTGVVSAGCNRHERTVSLEPIILSYRCRLQIPPARKDNPMHNEQTGSKAGGASARSVEAIEGGDSLKAEWRRPTITRIDLKRTLFLSGSFVDLSHGTT